MTDARYFFRYFLLLVIQVLLLNFFNFSQYLAIFFIPAAMLCIPVRHGGVFALLTAFVSGFLVDFFADGMLGLVTGALLPVAFARTYILQFIFGAEFFTRGEDVSFRRLGFWPVMFAVFLSTLLFFIVYVWADGAGTRPLWFNLVRIFASTLVSTVLSIFTVNVLSYER